MIADFSKVDTIVFDKTGTLTIGNPKVADVALYTDDGEKGFSYLVSVENESDHPLADGVAEYFGNVERCSVENRV